MIRGLLGVTLSALLLASSSPGLARPSELSAELSCPEAAPRGRVLCKLTVRAEGRRLTWADALVTRSPDFARPLRARVGFSQSTERADRLVVLPIALVAVSGGTGEVEVRARGVVCPETSGLACSPLTRRVRARIGVVAAEP